MALRVRASRAREIAPWYRRAGSHRAQSPSSSSSWVAYRNVAFHSGCLKWNRVGVAISADAAPICTTGWVEDDRGADACWSLCFRFWICFSPPNICFWLPSSGNSCLPLAELGPRQAAKSDAAPCLHYGGAGVQTPVLSLCLRCGFTERLSPAEAGLFRAALPRPEAGAAGRDRRVVGAAKNRQRQLRYPYSAVGLVTDIAHGKYTQAFFNLMEFLIDNRPLWNLMKPSGHSLHRTFAALPRPGAGQDQLGPAPVAGLFLRSSAQRATNCAARRWGGGFADIPPARRDGKPD